MSSSDCLISDTERELYSAAFPPSVSSPSPASSKPLFLCGTGVKGLDVQGRLVISDVIGVYLDPVAVPLLSVKWKGKTAEKLKESDPFFCEIITGPFEKFIKVLNRLPFTGQRFSEKLMEIYVPYWTSLGLYTDAEVKAVERFVEVFKDHITYPPNSSILFALSHNGSSLTVAFSKDHSIPETGLAVIDNKLLAEAVFESIIGKKGLAPGARLNLAKRLAQLMNKKNTVEEDATRTDQEEANDLSLDLSLGGKWAKEN